MAEGNGARRLKVWVLETAFLPSNSSPTPQHPWGLGTSCPSLSFLTSETERPTEPASQPCCEVKGDKYEKNLTQSLALAYYVFVFITYQLFPCHYYQVVQRVQISKVTYATWIRESQCKMTKYTCLSSVTSKHVNYYKSNLFTVEMF